MSMRRSCTKSRLSGKREGDEACVGRVYPEMHRKKPGGVDDNEVAFGDRGYLRSHLVPGVFPGKECRERVREPISTSLNASPPSSEQPLPFPVSPHPALHFLLPPPDSHP